MNICFYIEIESQGSFLCLKRVAEAAFYSTLTVFMGLGLKWKTNLSKVQEQADRSVILIEMIKESLELSRLCVPVGVFCKKLNETINKD